jgi:hypothetical protein
VVSVSRDKAGDIESAELTTGLGEVVRVEVVRERSESSACATLAFSSDGSAFLTVTCELSIAAVVTLRAASAAVAFSSSIDLKGGVRSIAPVSGEVNGHQLAGIFDPRTRRSTANTSLDSWLPQEMKEQLQPLVPFLATAAEMYRRRATVTNSRRRSVVAPNAEEPDAFNYAKAAACWGFAGLGAAAACAGTFGAGCAVGAFGFAAAASVCDSIVTS